MPEEFDSSMAAMNLAQLVETTSAAVRGIAPPATPAPLFYTLPDGSVADSKGNVLRPAPRPAPAKGA